MHRRALIVATATAAAAVVFAGCHRRYRREAVQLRRVRAEVTGDPVRTCDLGDEATRLLVREKLDAVAAGVVADSILRGATASGRPFHVLDPASTESAEGALSFELRRIEVRAERDGFVSLHVAAGVTLRNAAGDTLRTFQQEVRSKGGLELQALAPTLRYASLLATPPLPVFRDLEREVSGLAYWLGVRALERFERELR